MENLFGEVISAYSRRQAIEDGVLVDLNQGEWDNLARGAGIKWPLAMTAEAFYQTVAPEDGELPEGQDLKGRLWDVLWMLGGAIRRSDGGTEIRFKLIVKQRRGKPYQANEQRYREGGAGARITTLKAIAGPGDNGEPVITIMQPWQD